MNKILFLSGPTGVGKTDVGIRLAHRIGKTTDLRCEIVNFDSLLFYRELSIGTAKPTPTQRTEVVHHLIDTASIRKAMNAARFASEAQSVIDRLFSAGAVPLLVGGSGFYLRALVKGMIASGFPEEELREEIDGLYADEGIAPFRSYLEEHDPQSLEHLHKNDHYRIMRAFEYHRTMGQKFSKAKASIENPYDFTFNAHPHWDFLHLYLDIPPKEHEALIRRRTQNMLERGLVEEVRRLLAENPGPPPKALSSVGYKQILAHLSGRRPSPEGQLLEDIVVATRQLAKAQRTFFKKIVPKHPFNPLTQEDALTARVIDFLSQRG